MSKDKVFFRLIIEWLDKIIDLILKSNNIRLARWILGLYLITLGIPFLLVWFPYSIVDFTESGQIGDTIGGITAPFIGIIAGILTFLAFHEQYRSNVKTKDDLIRERFENKFYNFLNLLNNLEINTSIPNVGNYKQPFHVMLYEYKAIAVLIYRMYGKPKHKGNISDEMRNYIMKEAFAIFINGASESSTSRLKEYLSEPDKINNYFLQKQKYYADPKHSSVPYLSDYETYKIKLFDGHRLRMISFFRLFCKILEFIYEGGKIDEELYLSTLLSILSEHQLALLKLMYIYDNGEHDRFILKHQDKIKTFFEEDPDTEDVEPSKSKVCISKYIYTDIMNCTKRKFINFESKVGESSFI